jgi:hypothetical protein
MNVVGNPNAGSGIHTRTEWFNTKAFAAPPPYTYGNEKVNTLTSDWNRNVDLSLVRDFHIGLGEDKYFQFRASGFNVFNNVVFGVPDTTNTDTNYGQVTGQANGPRELQVALKFYY